METAEKLPQIRILGEIPNPYKLSHAQTAFENLKATNARMTMPTTIRTTSMHLSQAQLPQLATLFEFYNSIQYTSH